MRAAILLVCLVSAPAAATTDMLLTETLVGWSEDGTYFAVIRHEYTYDIDLVVYKGKTVVKTIPFEDPRVPGDLSRIDVATWGPLAAYKLAPVSAANRARFAAQLELVATGVAVPDDQHHACTGGGWMLRRGGTVVRQVWAGGTKCVVANGGYLSADNKHALVKVTAGGWAADPEAGGGYDTQTYFVAIDLP